MQKFQYKRVGDIYIPIWRDLKVSNFQYQFRSFCHLHSNMERFKDEQCLWHLQNFQIYIPIWRDLKSIPIIEYQIAACIYIPIWRDLKPETVLLFFVIQYLHSNMERFKGTEWDIQKDSSSIYIPIWRDLKQTVTPHGRHDQLIYIPIWRDLKGLCFAVHYCK